MFGDNLTPDVMAKLFQEGLLRKTFQDLWEWKNGIVLERLKSVGLSHLLHDLQNQRFKRLVIEKAGNIERWYADNGTIEGLLIVTFEEKINDDLNNFKIESTINYY